MAYAKIPAMTSAVGMGRCAHSVDVWAIAAIRRGVLMVSDASKAIVSKINVQNLTASLVLSVVRKAIRHLASTAALLWHAAIKKPVSMATA